MTSECRVYVEFIANEVVKEEKKLLETDVISMSDKTGVSYESPKKPTMLSQLLLDSSSPARINLQKHQLHHPGKTSILEPFQLPELIRHNPDLHINNCEEEVKQQPTKQVPKYMDTVLKVIAKIEKSVKEGKISTAPGHLD